MKLFSYALLCSFIFINSISYAQNGSSSERIKKISEVELSNTFLNKFFKNNEFSIYLTSDAKRIIANSESKFYIIDTETGEPLLDLGINANAANDFIVLEDRDMVLLPNTGKIRLFGDNERGELLAYNLEDGELLWTNNEMVCDFLYAGVPKEISAQEIIFQNLISPLPEGDQIYVSNSQFYSAFRYIPEKDAVLVTDYGDDNIGSRAHLIDLKTGEPKWTYKEKSIKIIDHKYYSDRDEIVLVGHVDGFGINGDILVLNASTGEQLHNLSYYGPYSTNASFFTDDVLTTAFMAVEIFDLDKGEKLASSANGDGMTFIARSMDGQTFSGLPPHTLITDDYIYTVRSKMMRNMLVPMFTGYNSSLIRYDLKTGEEMIIKENMKDVFQMIDVADGKILGYSKSGLKSQLLAFDKNTGEEIWESDKIKGFSSLDKKLAIENNKIIAGSDEEIFHIDLKTGKIINEIDLEKLKIGTLMRFESVSDNLMAIGKRGISFIGKEGNIEGSQTVDQNAENLFDLIFPSQEIMRAYWNDSKTYIFEEKKLTIYDNKQMSKLGEIEYINYTMEVDEAEGNFVNHRDIPDDKLFLSNNGKYFMQLSEMNGALNYKFNVYKID